MIGWLASVLGCWPRAFMIGCHWAGWTMEGVFGSVDSLPEWGRCGKSLGQHMDVGPRVNTSHPQGNPHDVNSRWQTEPCRWKSECRNLLDAGWLSHRRTAARRHLSRRLNSGSRSHGAGWQAHWSILCPSTGWNPMDDSGLCGFMQPPDQAGRHLRVRSGPTGPLSQGGNTGSNPVGTASERPVQRP